MPIRNVGTLLENLVVTEAALTLLREPRSDEAPFDFVNSFAMPSRTPWLPHCHDTGFDADTLERVRTATDPMDGYAGLLKANLRSDRDQGPNAALLVAGASLQNGVHCRMWSNDIRDGPYGDAIPGLEQIESQARAIYQIASPNQGSLSVHVSDAAYPSSFENLARVLQGWSPPPFARLAFLDPMGYRVRARKPCETSSADNRVWLRKIAFDDGITCVIHFTGNSHHPTLVKELRSLRSDATAEGYTVWRAFKRQHYAVYLSARDPRSNEAERVVRKIELCVQKAWDHWGRTFTFRNSRDWELKTYRSKKRSRSSRSDPHTRAT